MPIVTFKFTFDSLLSSHVHFSSATLTTPSMSIAAQDVAQSSYDVLLILLSMTAHTSYPLCSCQIALFYS